MSKLAILVIGRARSGKSTTWNRLFGRTVKTGTQLRDFPVGERTVSSFLVSASPQERKTVVSEIIGQADARLAFCSVQYGADARDTIDYFLANGFSIYAHWLNPGYGDDEAVAYTQGLVSYLLHSGAVLAIRDATGDPAERVQEIRDFVAGWASSRRF
jgi:hypothetical protein